MVALRIVASKALLATAAMWAVAPQAAQAQSAQCASPVEVQGFETCADVEKAKAEGAVVVYAPDVEQGTVKILKAFNDAFPMIRTSYVRLQTGALYARIMAERQAGSFLTDVVNLSDMGLALDFQKRGGYAEYRSPQLPNFKTEYKSQPEGFWTWGSISFTGIAYNPKTVSADEAPKDWGDLADPKWSGLLSLKSANSGVQHVAWYMLTEKAGKEYWDKIAEQKPRPFDSYVQQFDRIVNGEDKVASTALYSGYLEYMHRGAPIAFVYPTTGVPAGPEVWGVVKEAPHPQAARLFLDWFLSPVGQKAAAEALFMHSPRSDVPPPEGAKPIDEIKLLTPADWPAYLATRKEFVRFWGSLSGLR